ncbi:hypothetical protein ID866_341 [Astraeus odoratus]|nr:hypothetical protein ID866_341 [Astraeus odoratus]
MAVNGGNGDCVDALANGAQATGPVPKTILVVGLGMVGIGRFLGVLIGPITEAHLAYNRVALTEYFQHRSVEKLYLNQVEWYAQQDPERFVFHTGEQVTSLDTTAHSVVTSKGRVINYDYCVLATGSESTLPPYVPPERASATKGVFVYRNIADLDSILHYSEQDHVKGGRAVVVGGGLLGLEAAKAVFDLDTIGKVAIVNRQAYPLSRQLDDEGGEIVLRRIEAMGVDVLTKISIKDLVTSPEGVLTGLVLSNDEQLDAQMVIYAIGITPRDDLARKAGLECRAKGGVSVDDYLRTSAPDVYAIGECASWRDHTFGLIGPGVEMADILTFNLTQVATDVGGFKPRQMMPSQNTSASSAAKAVEVKTARAQRHGAHSDGPIECLTYRDPFSFVYKKYIFTADGKYLLGGMMVGDTSDYVKLVSLVKKKKAIDVPPSQFIVGSGNKGEEDGADLDDDAQVCSCHNVTKGDLAACVKSGVDTLERLKSKTKAGTGCGGCMPLVTNIFKSEMKKAGHAVSNNLCTHFAMTRQELFTIIKLRKLKTFPEVMQSAGVRPDSVGCELCKPAVASILSSLYNELVVAPSHLSNQDTNDRQRIDLFGAQKQDLPDIWEELVTAGFESGHAYGKALRTVKSCVGSTWCRYGIGDSVGMAIHLEERYKGIRSPHKIKGGVSGCTRECAEAQSKDFGLIATDKGWNIFLAGNGGTNPRHATLFAKDVPPSKVVRVLDRFLMYYIRTADRLMRTARWVEQFEGGIERLKKILLDDELGICDELEKEMDTLVGTYHDEWSVVVKDPTRRRQFRQFTNTDERRPQIEPIQERGQQRPADWPKQFPPAKFHASAITTPKSEWKWRKLAAVQDLEISDATSSAAVKYGDTQLAIFYVPRKGFFAVQQMCPHKRAFVLDHGIVGDDINGNLYVSCPLHKRNFRLTDGACLNDMEYSIISFDIKQEGDDLLVLLPESEELDAVIGTSKWMVKQATAEVVSRGGGQNIEIATLSGEDTTASGCSGTEGSCNGNSTLDW